MHRPQRAAAAAVAAVLLCGCADNGIALVAASPDDDDHGRAALLAAVEAHAAKPPTPANYRAFVLELRALRPRFNAEVAQHADLYETFFALPVLQAVADRPRDEQLDALALTVLPSAFGVDPAPGEDARAYLLRVCGREQPLECKQYVPEGWPVVLLARARRDLKHRASEALHACTICGDVAVYERMLAEFADAVAAEDAYAAEHADDYLPGCWALAGDRAQPVTEDAPLLAIDTDGHATLDADPLSGGDGEPLSGGSWVRALAAARRGRSLLAVHLRPGDRVRTLRAIERDAARAGYAAIALRVRRAGYPYPLREYRIDLPAGTRRVDVREVDTIQILARAVDAR